MKGFFTWFKSSTKLKRWMLVILVGIALVCYGVSNIIVLQEMEFTDVLLIAGAFVLGFVMIVLGVIYTQKRTLEILIEADVKSELVDIQSLIFNKNVYDKGPNIVVIGGGTGLNSTIEGLKKYTSNITAIIKVSERDKSLLVSREEIENLKAEDVIGSFVSLAEDDIVMEKLLNYKFDKNQEDSHTFGDIYLSVMKNIYGNIEDSIEAAGKVLNITGKVLPVTLDKINITAELKDGTIAENRTNIINAVMDKISPINRIYITPSNAKPTPGVIESITNADCIIIAPGSLYTTILPNLMIRGVAKAIKESNALKMYIANIVTEPGQTDDYTIGDHIDVIHEHVGKGIIDFCITDTGELPPEFIKRYNLKGADIATEDTQRIKKMGIRIIKNDFAVVKNDYIRHDSETLAKTIVEVICNDLKYKDKQNDPQYMLLNAKQKETKNEEKVKRKAKNYINTQYKKELQKNSRLKSNSKFSKKYNDRVSAIKSTDQNREENIKLYEKSVKLYENKVDRKEKEDKAKNKSATTKKATRAKSKTQHKRLK